MVMRFLEGGWGENGGGNKVFFVQTCEIIARLTMIFYLGGLFGDRY
jgi:hypothetical protein